jgi:hypothetical protein
MQSRASALTPHPLCCHPAVLCVCVLSVSVVNEVMHRSAYHFLPPSIFSVATVPLK